MSLLSLRNFLSERGRKQNQIRSIPVSSADAFVFQIQGVRVSYHIQARGKSFVHHTNAICVFQNINKQHKRELISQSTATLRFINMNENKSGVCPPLTRLDTLQTNKQREREKQSRSSDQHGVCRLARKTAETNEQLRVKIWSTL